VRWKITTYPSVTVQVDPFGTGPMAVHTVRSGVAEVTWREVYVSTVYPEDDEVTFDADGTVIASEGGVIYKPSDS
jgi:hypothetical protein